MPIAILITDLAGAALAPHVQAQCVIAFDGAIESAHFIAPAKMGKHHRAAVCIGLLECLRELGWTVAVIGADPVAVQLARLHRIETIS